jgi:pimeloyl-ACP methyl ester carboxylesterase
VAAALAVADAVGAERFRLSGASQGGQLAAAIAARHPDRVEALVVYGMRASVRDRLPAEVRHLLRRDQSLTRMATAAPMTELVQAVHPGGSSACGDGTPG